MTVFRLTATLFCINTFRWLIGKVLECTDVLSSGCSKLPNYEPGKKTEKQHSKVEEEKREEEEREEDARGNQAKSSQPTSVRYN